MQTPRGGIVSTINVAVGETVSSDQVLLTIASASLQEDGGDSELRQQALLDRQLRELQTQIDATEEGGQIERIGLQSRKLGLEQQGATLTERTTHHQRRLELAQAQVDAARQLHVSGHATANDLRKREEFLLDLKEQGGALRQQQIVIRNEIADIRQRLARLPSLTAEKVGNLRAAMAEIAQRRNDSASRQGYALRAPVAGRVISVQATIGLQVQASVPLIILLPEDAALQAELYVPTRAAGFLRRGLAVRLAYDAFPHEHFGTYEGQVQEIDTTVLAPNEVNAVIQLGEPTYRVRVVLKQQAILAFGQNFPLQSGMSVNGDVILESRRLYQWLLRPLYAAGSTAGI